MSKAVLQSAGGKYDTRQIFKSARIEGHWIW